MWTKRELLVGDSGEIELYFLVIAELNVTPAHRRLDHLDHLGWLLSPR